MNNTVKSNEAIATLKKAVEQKINVFDGNMHHGEFLLLSNDIFEKTQQTLSISTLKRIWGNIDYQSTPNLQTIEILAQYAGYKNWLKFIKTIKPSAIHKKNKILSKKHWLLLLILLLMLVGISFYFFHLHIPPHSYSLRFTNNTYPGKLEIDYQVPMSKKKSFHFIINSPSTIIELLPNRKQCFLDLHFPGKNKIIFFHKNRLLSVDSVYNYTKGWISLDENNSQTRWQEATWNKSGIINSILDYQSDKNIHLVNYQYFDYWDSSLLVNVEVIADTNAFLRKNDLIIVGLEFNNGWADAGFTTPTSSHKPHILISEKNLAYFYSDIGHLKCLQQVENKITYLLKNKRFVIMLNDQIIFKTEYRKEMGRLLGINIHSPHNITLTSVCLNGKETINK